MYLSNEENVEVDEYLEKLRDNPLVEMIYLVPDDNGVAIMTICNFNDSRNLISGFDKKEAINSISNPISFFNIKNKDSRLRFYSDDLSNYYSSIEEDVDYLKSATILFMGQRCGCKKKERTKI